MDESTGGTFVIVDREQLAAVASWVIDHKGPSWRQADRALRNLQPTLSRLKNGKLETVSGQVVDTLTEFLGGRGERERLQDLYGAIVSEPAQQLYRDYLAWLANATVRYPYVAARLTRYAQTSCGPEPLAPADDTGDLSAERVKARRVAFDRLYADEKCAAILHRFVAWMGQLGHEPPRCELALTRIIDPLVEAADAGFLERSLDDLSKDELRQFVRAGVARERILLEREPGLSRAASVLPASSGQTGRRRQAHARS